MNECDEDYDQEESKEPMQKNKNTKEMFEDMFKKMQNEQVKNQIPESQIVTTQEVKAKDVRTLE